MKYLKIFIITMSITAMNLSCNPPSEQAESKGEHSGYSTNYDKDVFFHYSIWWAFVNRVFDAKLTVRELQNKGDTGLGSFNRLDGEMVMIDGIVYRVSEDGTISEGVAEDLIVYANAAFFAEDQQVEISRDSLLNFEEMQKILLGRLPSPNFFYVFKLSGTFKYLKCGGLARQEPPFTVGLDVLIPNRPVYEGENIDGTMVGFYCPDFIGNINVKGFHFHFISKDKTLGGHVMEFNTTEKLIVQVDKKTSYNFVLPDNEAFAKVSLEQEFQYKKDDQ